MADGPLFALGDKVPRVDPTAYVAPTAAVIGDVEIGAGSSIWFACVLRGDHQPIRVGARTNIQDGTIVHITAASDDHPGFPAIIGDDVTIGHGAIIHACVIEDWGFVGMGATVLDGAVIGRGGMLAAGALLTPGKRIGPYELWQGAPARLARVMTEQDRARFALNAPHYVHTAAHFRSALRGL
jgi:carbonic anhydrase/acetyltransferase-like protein (isoleucine patch superfamily)